MENTAPQPNPVAAQVVDQVQQPNANGVPGSLPGETQAQTQARLYRVTVDGQDFDIDENELKRGYAHNQAAQKRMQEAAMQRKEAEQVVRMFKENPKQAFKMLGADARAFAEQIINEELEDALLSPQERELRTYKQQVAEYEAQRRQAQEQYERQMLQQQVDQQTHNIQNEIISVLDNNGLPKTERTVGRIIYYMQASLAAGYNVSPKDVIEQVREDYKQDLRSMLGGLPEDALEVFLGSDLIRKAAKTTIKKQKDNSRVSPSVNENRRETLKEKKIQSPKDFFKNL